MAKSKKEKEQQLSLFQRFSKKVRIVVVNAESFEEKRHFTLSPLNAVVLLSFFTLLIIIGTYLIIGYTPLKHSIPGMPDLSSELKLRKIDLENISAKYEGGILFVTLPKLEDSITSRHEINIV